MKNVSFLSQAIVAFLAMACSATVVAAPGDESLSRALLECAAVTDDADRLLCFDDKVSEIQPAPVVESAAGIPVAESVVVVKAAENQVAESMAVASGDQAANSTTVKETAENPPAMQSAAAVAADTPTDTPAAVQQAATPAAESGSSPATSAVDEFGMTAELSDQLPAGERPVELTEISATVTEVSKRPYGEHVVTLANGQVWTEKRAESGFRVKVGDTIIIKKGRLGGFRIVGRGNRSSAVVRIK